MTWQSHPLRSTLSLSSPHDTLFVDLVGSSVRACDQFSCVHFRVLLMLATQEPVSRLMGISETCVIERDPATYNVVTLRALSDV